jgi:hypothetical protein
MFDVGLMHPFEAEGLNQLHDALEARAHIPGLSIKLGLHLGVEKDEE